MSPAISALLTALVAVGSLGLAYLVYRQSNRKDVVAEQAGIATKEATSIGQVMEGLKTIGDALARDNENLRQGQARHDEHIKRQDERIEQLEARLEAVEVGNRDLRTRERELERENGVLRAENAALKLEVEELTARVAELEKLNGT